jgi:hypothetical protein
MNKFVDQLNLCVLVIMPSFVPLAFSPTQSILAPPLFQPILISQKQEPIPIFKTRAVPKLGLSKTTGT